MQRSPIAQFVVFFTLLCVYSQAYPLLDRSSGPKYNPAAKTETDTDTETETRNHYVKLNRPDDDGRQHRRGDSQHGNDELVVTFNKGSISEILSKQQSSNDKLANNVKPIHQSSSIPDLWDSSTANQAPLAVQASNSLLPTSQAKTTTTSPYSTGSKSTSSRQRNSNFDLRLTTPTEAAENELLQTHTDGQRLFRQRDGDLAISIPLRTLEASSISPSTKRPSLAALNNLYATPLSNPLSHLPNEQHGRSWNPLPHQSAPSWLSLPFRRHHASRVPEYQRSSSKPNPFRHALTRWFSFGRHGGQSSGALPIIGAARKPISEREPIFGAGWRGLFGESFQRSTSLGKPETVFGAERSEQLLFTSDQHEYPFANRGSLLSPQNKKPYLGISWDREERAFRDAKKLLSKVSNHLMTFIPTTVDGVTIPRKITSAQAPPWTQAHSILLEQERKSALIQKRPPPFFQGLHALIIKHTIRPSSPYRFKFPALGGTIHMASPSQHTILPIAFNLTPQSCLHHAIKNLECECLSQDIADEILESYIPTSSDHTIISKSVSTDMNAVEHRATLDLSLTSSQHRRVEKEHLQTLLGLLLSTKKQLSHTSQTPFSTITTSGELHDIVFNATWSYQQYKNGIPLVCA